MDFYRDKRVLVTGHTGFKGAWLCRILTLAGAQVTGYSLEPPTDPNLFEIAGLEDVMDSVIGDIRNLQELKDVFERVRPEVVFHLAAQPIVRDSYKDPVYTYETNVMGTVNVMECVRLTDSVRSFLNVTTDKVYENREWEYGLSLIHIYSVHSVYRAVYCVLQRHHTGGDALGVCIPGIRPFIPGLYVRGTDRGSKAGAVSETALAMGGSLCLLCGIHASGGAVLPGGLSQAVSLAQPAAV